MYHRLQFLYIMKRHCKSLWQDFIERDAIQNHIEPATFILVQYIFTNTWIFSSKLEDIVKTLLIPKMNKHVSIQNSRSLLSKLTIVFSFQQYRAVRIKFQVSKILRHSLLQIYQHNDNYLQQSKVIKSKWLNFDRIFQPRSLTLTWN